MKLTYEDASIWTDAGVLVADFVPVHAHGTEIVRRYNAYDSLVAALRKIEAVYDNSDDHEEYADVEASDMADIAKQALIIEGMA